MLTDLPPLPEPMRKSGQQISYDGADKAFCDMFSIEQMTAYGQACQAATLATVTPLVQMLVDGLEHHMLQTRPITVTEILLAEARAFLSGATKESTDHG